MNSITLKQKLALTVVMMFLIVPPALSQFESKKPPVLKTKSAGKQRKNRDNPQGFQFLIDDNSYITDEQVTQMLDLRLKNFAECLELLVNKRYTPQEVIDGYAMKLFNNDESILIQVTRKNGEKRTFKVREYLNRIAVMQYKSIEVSYGAFSYKSPLHRGKDSVIHGSYTATQTFYGINAEGQTYQDKTRKEFNFNLALGTDSDTRRKIFNLFLGDIIVVEKN